MPGVTEKLVRKQFLVYPSQIKKMEALANKENTSVAEMVRKAITAFNPEDDLTNMKESELLSLVAANVKEALADTRKTRRHLDKTLKKLEAS